MAPSWGLGPWKFEVSEEAPPNTFVTILKAHDPDTIGTIRYSLITAPKITSDSYNNVEMQSNKDRNEIDKQFKLDSITGQLKLAEALDREIQEKYILKIRADDGLQHTDLNLVIQVMMNFFIFIR